jgi:hypothetical protein
MPFELLPEEAPQAPEESFLSQAGRGVARTASRIGEQIAGTPGDIFSLINEYVAKPTTEAITGKSGVPYEETSLGKVLPTTETHRKRLEKGFGEVLKPQNKVEKFIDEVFQDATSLAIPGLKGAKLGTKAAKSLAIATGANVLGDLVKDWTADEKKAGMAKLGSLFMLSLFDKPKAAQAIGELYKPLAEKVEKLRPVNATGLEMSLNNLKNKVSKGTLAPSEKFVVDEVDAILSKIKDGKITPEEAWATKRSLNEKLSKILFDIPKKSDQARARKLSQNILGDLDNVLKETAKQDPKFYKDLKKADKAFGTIAKSNLVSNYIEKNMRYNPVTHGLMNAFQGSLGSMAASAVVPYEIGKILYRISHSSELAKHYARTLSAAAKEDAVIMNKELKKLDQGLQKQEKKDRFILMD